MQARYKLEAYRGSEFAPRVFADHGLRVTMKVRFITLCVTPIDSSFNTYLVWSAGVEFPLLGIPGAATPLLRVTTQPRPLGYRHDSREGYEPGSPDRLRKRR